MARWLYEVGVRGYWVQAGPGAAGASIPHPPKRPMRGTASHVSEPPPTAPAALLRPRAAQSRAPVSPQRTTRRSLSSLAIYGDGRARSRQPYTGRRPPQAPFRRRHAPLGAGQTMNRFSHSFFPTVCGRGGSTKTINVFGCSESGWCPGEARFGRQTTPNSALRRQA